jgi:hypothetical protein
MSLPQSIETSFIWPCNDGILDQILSSLKLIQMLQSRQYNLLTRLLYLAGQEYLIQNSVDL